MMRIHLRRKHPQLWNYLQDREPDAPMSPLNTKAAKKAPSPMPSVPSPSVPVVPEVEAEGEGEREKGTRGRGRMSRAERAKEREREREREREKEKLPRRRGRKAAQRVESEPEAPRPKMTATQKRRAAAQQKAREKEEAERERLANIEAEAWRLDRERCRAQYDPRTYLADEALLIRQSTLPASLLPPVPSTAPAEPAKAKRGPRRPVRREGKIRGLPRRGEVAVDVTLTEGLSYELLMAVRQLDYERSLQ
ncbi:hypothetical protein KIPB_004626 [Kipferlia bialata]|uniref:Uncharacterized protein n=1 Tax=Kipferlia bialata TaxID=797122 RepID=A0A9K3GHY1_9EUKA|nr:hypothetical protein KIPB_004626 [Kipferlia bialata]|eukprot:g4626.t1